MDKKKLRDRQRKDKDRQRKGKGYKQTMQRRKKTKTYYIHKEINAIPWGCLPLVNVLMIYKNSELARMLLGRCPAAGGRVRWYNLSGMLEGCLAGPTKCLSKPAVLSSVLPPVNLPED